MDRTERLLDLVALFLDAREPLSWGRLREHFPGDYDGISDDAAERKFERDKAELLELGLPLTYVQGDDERSDGYVVDRAAYYLPEVGLTKEELAVLYAAGSAALTSEAFPGRQDLAHALRKIGFYAGAELPSPRVRMELGGAAAAGEALAQRLEALWPACTARKWVELRYQSPRQPAPVERRVDPYGLALRRGVWTLVGYCHLRQALRSFQVQRIQDLRVNTARPRTPDFQVPADFALDAHVAHVPWQHRIHEPVTVVLRLSGELSARAPGLFPGAALAPLSEPGVLEVRVQATFLDSLLRFCLALGPHCRVEAPEAARVRAREMAQRVLERHADGARQERVRA